MNIGPLIRTIEPTYAARPMERILGDPADGSACLLELRTDMGLIYVRPTGWQRIRLRWTFRHFHVLPSQLLSRGDQRLIEKLSRSAMVIPSLPTPRSTVFGVVENVRAKSDRAVVFSEEPRKPVAPQGRLHVVRLHVVPDDQPAIVPDDVRVIRFPQWRGAVATFAAIAFIVYGVFTATTHSRKSSEVSLPAVHAAPPIQPPAGIAKPSPVPPEPTLVSRISAPINHLRKAVVDARPVTGPAAAPEPAVTPAAAIAPATPSSRLIMAELPQGHLVQPVLTDPNLTGQLELRALIAADGSVKEVTLVSGDPRLAQAATRAVSRWRYSPSQTAGLQGEGETLIRMNFFGRDAVSITSVAR